MPKKKTSLEKSQKVIALTGIIIAVSAFSNLMLEWAKFTPENTTLSLWLIVAITIPVMVSLAFMAFFQYREV